MNARAVATEVAGLTAGVLWVYAGAALFVASLGEGSSVSFGAVTAVVVLSYGLSWLLQRFDVSDHAMRVWGVGLSIGLLYLILRVEIAGEPYVWDLAWLRDLLVDTGATLEGHAPDMGEVIVLAIVWLLGVYRGVRASTFESLLAEASVGLVVILTAVAFASTAGAPGALRWLPVPYMVAVLLALALSHLQSAEEDRRRPFLGVWTLWIGGSLAVMAGLATLASLFDPPSLRVVGEGLAVPARAVGLAVASALEPFFAALTWAVQHILDWVVRGEAFKPDEVNTDELRKELEEKRSEPPGWALVVGYVARVGLIALVILLALGALWFVFRRLSRRREDEDEAREDVAPEAGSPLGDLRSLLSGAFGRLGGRASGLPGDAVGRLYVSMLRRAESAGLPRPPSATPLEFAPRLDEHFDSPVPGSVSSAYSIARYGSRAPPKDEMGRLQREWREIERASP